MSKVEKECSGQLLEDITELCVCCTKSVVVIAKRHNQDPRDISKLFLEMYNKINDDVARST